MASKKLNLNITSEREEYMNRTGVLDSSGDQDSSDDREYELGDDSEDLETSEDEEVLKEIRRQHFSTSTPKKATRRPSAPLFEPDEPQPGPSSRPDPVPLLQQEKKRRKITRESRRTSSSPIHLTRELSAPPPRNSPPPPPPTYQGSDHESRVDDPTPQSSASSISSRRRRREVSPHPPLVNFGVEKLVSRSGYEWKCNPHIRKGKSQRRNIVHYTKGPTVEARTVRDPLSAFLLFFPDEVIQEIVEWTNRKIEVSRRAYKTKDHKVANTNELEMKAFIGCLIMTGCQKSNHLNYKELWSPNYGCPVYRSAMSSTRFEFLVECLRFDNPDTREERRKTDKFAPIRSLWERFIRRSGQLYVPGEYLTIDEQLLSFRGRCGFRMYIPNKPAKYGLKLVLCCDAQTKYLVGGILYAGKQEPPPQGNLSLGHYYVRELMRPYFESNRNVTVDNWFTSIPLTQDLFTHGITLVGTIKAIKPEIPAEMRTVENRTPGSAAFLHDDYMTLVSYAPRSATKKPKKLVHVLTTMDNTASIGMNGKPEAILLYNVSKGGVDTFDQMAATYSCNRKTRRWPLCIFYGLLNAGGINAWIILSHNLENMRKPSMKRRNFLTELAVSLVKPWAKQRLSLHIPRPLAGLICTTFNLQQEEQQHQDGQRDGALLKNSKFNPLHRCKSCPRGDKRSRYICKGCRRSICGGHLYTFCFECTDKTGHLFPGDREDSSELSS
ncbi:hypothetical protein Pcinc_003576 [Petrolisthes cinctipes]|uniref:PiggyBac transposable element-derived protein domain-containing protein n=1 Tax=Petrolisthes cinctipes TaxID=88211 RepID=A0AAE1L4K5_PETCI|nr:hypothetical protein Pcinc_003576 [Petrolisthes cinctipes]